MRYYNLNRQATLSPLLSAIVTFINNNYFVIIRRCGKCNQQSLLCYYQLPQKFQLPPTTIIVLFSADAAVVASTKARPHLARAGTQDNPSPYLGGVFHWQSNIAVACLTWAQNKQTLFSTPSILFKWPVAVLDAAQTMARQFVSKIMFSEFTGRKVGGVLVKDRDVTEKRWHEMLLSWPSAAVLIEDNGIHVNDIEEETEEEKGKGEREKNKTRK